MVSSYLFSALRRYWYLPLAMMVISVGSQELWVRFSGPTEYESRVSVVFQESDGVENQTRREIMASLRDPEHPARARVILSASELLRGERSQRADAPVKSVDEVLSGLRRRCGAPSEMSRFLATAMDIRRRDDGRHLDVAVRSRASEEALVVSWALAEAVSEVATRELRDRSARELFVLREEEGLIDEEWRSLIQQRLEFTDDLGVASARLGEEGDGFIQRLILEAEEEISRFETRRLELSKLINNQELRRKLGSRESGADDAPEELQSPDFDALHGELVRTRLDYEVQSRNLPERHPRILGLKEKILALEKQLVDESRSSPSTEDKSNDNDDMVQEYRTVVLKIETLRRRSETFARNLKNFEQLHPDLDKIDAAIAVVKKRLAPIRERMAALEWSLAQGQIDFATVQPESARAPMVIPPGAGFMWKLLAAAMGCVIGICLAWTLCRLDTHLYSDREVRQVLKLPVLAKIPRLGRKEIQDPESGLRPGVRERFNAAATVVRSVARELDMKVFSVVSAMDGEGKSLVAIHLSVALARKGLRVALVEGNLRQPELHNRLGLENDVGLMTIIEGNPHEIELEQDGLAVEEIMEMDPDDEDSVFAVLQRAINANLFVLTSGPLCDSPIAALEGAAMESTVKTLSRIMDYVVIDTPSVERGGESLALAALSDACVMVVGSGECESGEALWAKSLFTNVQTSVLGVVLNKCSRKTSRTFELAGWKEENSESVVVKT